MTDVSENPFPYTDNPVLPDSVQASRMAVCDSCPELLPDRRCSTCECLVDKLVRREKNVCPLDKWPKESI